MSKINKLITNKPVTLTEEEVTNLSKTLSAVQTAGGGGGGGGRVYYGDGTTVSVNQIDGIISLTTEATEKLNTPIPTKVSDLTDYADYQTVDMMSAYLTTAQYNTDSAKFATRTELETTARLLESLIPSTAGLASEAWVAEQGYLTKPSGDSYYTPLPDGLSDDQYYAYTTSGWKPVQGGGQGGISTVAHDSSLSGNGNTENLGIKTDAALNLPNASVKSAVSAVWATKAMGSHTEYQLGSTLDTMSNITAKIDTSLMSMTGYNGIERQIDGTTDYVSAFGLTNTAYGAVQYVTANSGKFVTSGDEITGDFQYALTTNGWAKIQGGSTFTGVTTTGSISGGGVNNDTIGLLTSAENALFAVDGKMTKPATAQDTNYVVWNKGPAQEWTSFVLAANSWANDFLLDANAPFVNGNNGLSAGLVPGADNYVYAVGIDTANMTANKQYAFTTTGWEEVVVPSTSGYLPTSGGTVSGELVVSATSGNFDSQYLKLIREGVNGYGRIGLGSNGPLALKVDDANSHTTQINISPNATNDQLVQVQHGGTTAYLIPAQIHQGSYTPTTADGILHIVLES